MTTPAPQEHLAGHPPGPHRLGLQPAEVQEPLRVQLPAGHRPQGVDVLKEGLVLGAAAKGDADADLVVVNTCGFIDAAVEESLDAIGEAMERNGRVIVTGCLGVKEEEVRAAHPAVLAVTGP